MKTEELSKLVRSCRQTLATAAATSSNRKELNEALFDALQDTFRIWQKFKKLPNAREKVFEKFEIEELRKGTNPFNRFARLCIPGRRTNDYNRYASALTYFDEQGWSSAKAGKQLRDHGLTHFSDRGRKRQNRTPTRNSAGGDRRIDLAKQSLNEQKPITVLDMSGENLYLVQKDWAILIAKVPSDPKDDNIPVIASADVGSDVLDQIFLAYAEQERLLTKERRKKARKT